MPTVPKPHKLSLSTFAGDSVVEGSRVSKTVVISASVKLLRSKSAPPVTPVAGSHDSKSLLVVMGTFTS